MMVMMMIIITQYLYSALSKAYDQKRFTKISYKIKYDI